MPVHQNAKLKNKEQLNNDTYKYTIKSTEIAKEAKPGQFLEIRVADTISPLLRRPISIFNVNKENSEVEFIFQVKGEGTEILSKKDINDEIDVLGPLGNGNFDIKDYQNVAIIGGGIGIFPLYELAKQLKQTTKTANISIYLGFRNKELVLLEKEFSKVCNNLIITTDDGSYGKKGFSINELKQDHDKENFDMIYACGPLGMLKAVKQYTKEKNIMCQISLEEKMGCGIGACLGCAVEYKEKENKIYKHVCKDGPVFNADKVVI